MMHKLFRASLLCGLLLISACASQPQGRYMPVPSAARGGVAPQSEAAQAVFVPATPAPLPAEIPAPGAPVAAIAEPPAPASVPPAPPQKPALAAPVLDQKKTKPHIDAAAVDAALAPAAAPTPVAAPPHHDAIAATIAAAPPAPIPGAASAALPQAAHGSGGYILGIGDDIKMTVYGEDDLSGQYEVGSTGVVALPLIGDIPAAGRSIGEFEAAVAAKLSEGYLKDPRVSVQISNYRPFFILGEVAKPGNYPYINGMTVISAVAVAGGYTYRADRGDIRVMHANDPSKTEHDVDETSDVVPGDVIRVTERFF